MIETAVARLPGINGLPEVTTVEALPALTLAILLLFVGKGLSARIATLRRYSIPEPVVGGVLCAAVVCALYYGMGMQVDFELGARDMFLLYFFAALGLNSRVAALARGGWKLVVLLALAGFYIVFQNLVGMGLAGAWGMDPRAGLMVGSVSLTGGVGTTIAWTPHFVDELGIANAGEIGLAANMVGMIAACVVGGPIAGWLIKRHPVMPSADAELEVGTLYGDESRATLDYTGVLLALFWLNIALMLGHGISHLIGEAGLLLPEFVGALVAGILLRLLGDLFAPNGRRMWRPDAMQPGIALISDISLGLFLVMALMGLQLWVLEPLLGFLSVAMLVQVTLVVLFSVFVVFKAMGGDYESAVVSSAFGGIALGSTATAMANMTAVSREYGAAPRAFVIVPLVCGFFIDIANAVIVGVMAG
ncbi:sodium/glutamate symporter [Luteimonas dalianensis]|uniref:sodium/glutamate symporter n=1 Tax=Luteimonas dalianensis TaxID=1148196 RepID=UPI003BF2FCCE